jgi:AraC-like DNA-binding protein
MDDVASISWSTDVVGPGQRLAAWQSFLVDAFQECDMEYEANGDFWARMSWSRYGEITIGKISGSRRTAVRTDTSAKFAEDGVVMSIACQGRYSFAQARREHLIEPGEAYFFHNCLPGAFAADEGGEYWLISLPAKSIIPGFGDSESLIGCRITDARSELRLLTAYLDAVYQTPGLRDPKTRQVIGGQVTDLIVAAVGRAHEEAQASGSRGIRAARYKLVLEEIRRRFSEPLLNGERIARALGVSERYIQQLFEENGRTVSAQIMNERLKAARRLLGDPAQDHLKVTDVAFNCGFSDLSNFTRAFRRKYGETPKAVRSTE